MLRLFMSIFVALISITIPPLLIVSIPALIWYWVSRTSRKNEEYRVLNVYEDYIAREARIKALRAF